MEFEKNITKKREKLKERAKARQVPFNLTQQDVFNLMSSTDCPCCMRQMTTLSNDPHQISIDRLIPSKGYTTKNTVAICKECNGLKADLGPAELHKRGLSAIAKWTEQECQARQLVWTKKPDIYRKLCLQLGKVFIKAGHWLKQKAF